MANTQKKLTDLFNGKSIMDMSVPFSLPNMKRNIPSIQGATNSIMQSSGVTPSADATFRGMPVNRGEMTQNAPISQQSTNSSPVVPQRNVQSQGMALRGVPITPGTDAEIAAQVAKINGTPVQGTQGANIPQQWLKPDGGVYSPEEIASNIAQKFKGQGTAGDIGTIAKGEFIQGKTPEQLRVEAENLNNLRNDIATGTSDPTGTASKSGIAYSPQELAAIEKSAAGIYDPALATAHAKLKSAEEAEKAKVDFENTLKQLAVTHDYDMKKLEKDNEFKMALEKMKINADIAKAQAKATSSTSTPGVYVKGENPIVDGWVEKILKTGEDINKLIPGVSNQNLRNQVMLGLNARRYESAATAGTLSDVNTLNQLLQNPDLNNISGAIGQFTGGLFGKAKTAKTLFDQISGTLQLAKAGQIKGQGAVSDYERSVLKQAAIAADRGQSDKDFRDALIKIRGAMMTSSGLEAPVKIVDPSTGESQIQNLNSNEITEFIRDGALIEYVEQ